MGVPRGPLVCRFLAITVLAAAPAGAEEGTFFKDSPTLPFLERRLPAGATLAIPPSLDPPLHVVTDLELRTALAGVIDDFLAPPGTFASKAADLIGEICRYRPAKTAEWIAVATDSTVEYSLSTAEKDLAAAVAVAIAANPGDGGLVVRTVIDRLVAQIEAGRCDRATAARVVEAVVFTAVKTAARLPQGPALVADIADQAIGEAMRREASDLAAAAMAAAVRGSAGIAALKVNEVATEAMAKYGETKLQASLLSAAAVQGAGVGAAIAINDATALRLPVAFSSYANIACSAFAMVAEAPDAAAANSSNFINVARADYIPAVVVGAVMANPRAAVEILQAGLNRDLVLRGRVTVRDLVEAAVLASPQHAPQLVVAAVGRGDLEEGNAAALIAEGLARGAPAALIGVALAALIDAQEKSAANLRATVAGAITGAVAMHKTSALSAIARAAAADSRFTSEVLDQTIVSSPPNLQYRGVLAVLAAQPDQAAALLERALKHRDLAPGQAAPIAAAGRVVLAIQADPTSSLRATVRQLGEVGAASPEMMEAIVLGAALANPRGASAAVSGAVAFTDVPMENLAATAGRAEPAMLAQIAAAAEIAVELKGNPGRLYDCVRSRVAATPEIAAEIVTGALATAPAEGQVIAQAAGRAAPAQVTRIVPRLFAYSTGADAVETSMILVGGVVHGVIAANLEASAESNAIADAVAASVRSAVTLARRPGAAVPEADAVAAVATAATRAASVHSVEVARVAARSARALACPAETLASLRDALLAAGSRADAGKIAEAIGSGIAEAELQKPATDAKRLLDYAHDSLTGVPMTQFRDL